jgi:CDP-2,3-bis-(O-geranylgeranyl)-sn-glycerol synthase
LGWGWYGAHAAWAIPAGAWVGGFAMVGDALKSAVKRKLGVTPGKPFPPWDQLDFILGATAPMAWFGMGDWVLFVTAIVITPLLHLLVNIVAYWTGYKEVWW